MSLLRFFISATLHLIHDSGSHIRDVVLVIHTCKRMHQPSVKNESFVRVITQRMVVMGGAIHKRIH